VDYRLYQLGSGDKTTTPPVILEHCLSDESALQSAQTHLILTETYRRNTELKLEIFQNDRRVFQGTMAQLLSLARKLAKTDS